VTWRRRAQDSELAEEIRQHLDEAIDAFVAQGLTRADAEAAARRSFGNVTLIEERSRDVWRRRWLVDAWADLRFGARQLRRAPSFAAAAIVTLALGIAATTAIFSIANAALLNPLPYPHGDRLVSINEIVPMIGNRPIRLTAPDLVDYQTQSRSFDAVAGWTPRTFELSGSRESQRVDAARVTASLFDVLQVAPARGRAFTAREDRDGVQVCVISHELWQEWFGGDRGVLDSVVRLDRQPYRVVGVMPAGFRFPLSNGNDVHPVQIWIPMSLTPEERQDRADSWDYNGIARLKPGVTIAQASADVNAIAQHILRDVMPAEVRALGFTFSAVARPLAPQLSGPVRPLVLALGGAVGCLLLIACVNVANLLLARGAHRRREMSVRAALGAGRGRLVRQLICETVLFGAIAAAIGGLLAWWSTGAIARVLPDRLAILGSARFDWPVLLCAAVTALGAAIAAGIAPALVVGRDAQLNALGDRGSSGSAGQRRIRRALVVAEIALALVLLVGAGLLIRTFDGLLRASGGFSAGGGVAASISLPRTAYPDAASERRAYATLLDRLHAFPDTQFAGMATTLPLSGTRSQRAFWPDHYNAPDNRFNIAAMTVVSPEYLQAIGATLIRGRLFTPQDDRGGQPVALVSESLARQYWPGEDAVGKRLKWGLADSKEPWLTVVGVVGDIKQEALDQPAGIQVYVAADQLESSAPSAERPLRSMCVVLRGGATPEALAAHLREAIRGVDSTLAISRLAPLEDTILLSTAPQRFNMVLMSAFAVMALTLAVVGLYGLIAYAVAQRGREIGIRMAMGARGSAVMRMIVGEGMALALTGVAIGCAAAAALAPALRSLLYGVTPFDVPTFAAVATLLLIVAAAATYIPARRATRIDPTVALRGD
jgi:putative ABC transport system permease protein